MSSIISQKRILATLSAVALFQKCSAITNEELLKFDYIHNGLDWPDNFPGCQGDYQSPIDLRTENHSDPFPVNYDDHDYTQSYIGLLEPVLRRVAAHIVLDMPDGAGTAGTSTLNYFNSSWAADTFGSASPIFNAT